LANGGSGSGWRTAVGTGWAATTAKHAWKRRVLGRAGVTVGGEHDHADTGDADDRPGTPVVKCCLNSCIAIFKRRPDVRK
jgi:hypothetical protein